MTKKIVQKWEVKPQLLFIVCSTSTPDSLLSKKLIAIVLHYNVVL